MDYVNLGRTGLRVSRVCLGMMSYGKHESREWTLDEQDAEPIVRRAVEGGITLFDTADVYNGGPYRDCRTRGPRCSGRSRTSSGSHALCRAAWRGSNSGVVVMIPAG